MFSESEISILNKLWATARYSIPTSLDQNTRDNLPNAVEFTNVCLENDEACWNSFEQSLLLFLIKLQCDKTSHSDFWISLTYLHYPIQARLHRINTIPVFENQRPENAATEIEELREAAKKYLQTIERLREKLSSSKFKIGALNKELNAHVYWLEQLAADKTDLVDLLKQQDQPNNSLIGASGFGFFLTLVEYLNTKNALDRFTSQLNEVQQVLKPYLQKLGTVATRLKFDKLASSANKYLLTLQNKPTNHAGENPAKLPFDTHDHRHLFATLNSKTPPRSEVVKSAIAPGQYENRAETPILSLLIAVKLLIHSGGVITFSEFHHTMVRAGFYFIKKTTLSARLSNWSKTQNYFMRLVGAKSGWVLNPEGIERLKAKLEGIDDIDWDAIPPINPDDDIDSE